MHFVVAVAQCEFVGGYDSIFVQEALNKLELRPTVIFRASSSVSTSLSGIGLRWIDSFNFIAQALATFPQTFGLDELKKGVSHGMLGTIMRALSLVRCFSVLSI